MEDTQTIREPYVFLSHSGKNAPLALELAKTLRRVFGGELAVFNSSEPEYRIGGSLQVGDDWKEKILQVESILGPELVSRIEHSVGVLLLVTPMSLKFHSQWIQLEIDSGSAQAKKKNGQFFIPIVAEDGLLSRLPETAAEFQGVDVSTAEGLQRLITHVSDVCNLGVSPIDYRKTAKHLAAI